MQIDLTVSYKEAARDAPIRQCIERALRNREDVEHVYRASQAVMTLLDNDRPVLVRELSNILTKAENMGLVSREGMKMSGLYFAVHENRILAAVESQENEITMDHRVNVSREEGRTTAYHLYKASKRALNILDNPNGYTPRCCNRLYGGRPAGFEVAIP